MIKQDLRAFLKDWCAVVGPEEGDATQEAAWEALFEELYHKHFKDKMTPL